MDFKDVKHLEERLYSRSNSFFMSSLRIDLSISDAVHRGIQTKVKMLTLIDYLNYELK